MKSFFYCCLLISVTNCVIGQKADYSTLLIPQELKENANAIIRLDELNVAITSQRDMTMSSKTVTTVLNEQGLENLDLSAYYDKNRKVSKIEAKVYDAFGKEIKTIKRRDFRDVSVGDGFSIFNDNRALYFDYTPINYPFTVVFETVTETSNTAFLPNWLPVGGYYVSTEKANISITYPKSLGFKAKEVNFAPKYNIRKTDGDGQLSYTATNVHAMKGEESSPEFRAIAPIVYMKLEKFNLEGVDGEAKNWQEFGKWYYDNLLVGTDELPVETQNKIKQLVGNEKDPIAIAKIVYKYVQDKTRYVSIQIGIGGFKPMLAKDVDKLGYGDCKALSNYTRSLLQVVGVPSYYTVAYAGNNTRKGLQADFASVQGNHAILAIPVKNELVWLECTSQIQPFGFQGTFTDGRDVLLIKPDGGEIVRTKSFLEKDNSQFTNGNYIIATDGSLSGKISIVSKGSQYDRIFKNERLSEIDKEAFYKHYFDNINNLKLDKISFKNNAEDIAFTQDIQLSAPGYAANNAGKLMFVLDAFNVSNNTPKKYRNRENPFEVSRGFYDYDEITINLPSGYEIEAIPGNFETKSKFGEYNTQILKNADNTLTYKRALFIKNGNYDSKEYDDYRLFREQIARNDNAKIILTKKN